MENESEQELKYINCALCNLDDTENLCKDRRFNLVRCRRCGLVYINPRPTRDELNRMYNVTSHSCCAMDHAGYMDLAYLHELKARKSLRIIKKHKKEGRILDIGCAAGFFLNQARKRGFKTHGVEMSRDLCYFAQKDFKLDVFCGTLIEASYPSEYFDVVTMFDVLSHLPTPVEELKEVNRILRKGGLLVVETGNKGELDATAVKKWKGVWGSPSHLYHFGGSTLQRLFGMTGFDCIETDRSSVILSSIMEAFVKRLIGPERREAVGYQQLQLRKIPRLINTALMKVGAHLYLLIKYGLGKILPKSNTDCTIIVCCRKRSNVL